VNGADSERKCSASFGASCAENILRRSVLPPIYHPNALILQGIVLTSMTRSLSGSHFRRPREGREHT
jgi:hypothetical protein